MEEEKVKEKSETEPKAEAVNEHLEHKKDPFSLIGKVAVVVIITAILVVGGIYLGMTLKTSPTPAPSNPITTSTPSAQPTTAQTIKTITAGGTTGSSSGTYAIDIPAGWTYTTEKNDVINTLTLTKNGYSIQIYQAAMGGGGCLYPNDPETIMSQRFTDYVEIQGAPGKLRRSWSTTGTPASSITYTICQLNKDGTMFGLPTSFGSITVKAPYPSDQLIMKEVDFMLSSLTQK